MFDFKVSTHAHYDDSFRKFALTHNMEDVAQRAGMRAQTLCNKLNPDQPHQLADRCNARSWLGFVWCMHLHEKRYKKRAGVGG